MKLFATIQNVCCTKVSIGGNEKLVIGLNKSNKNIATIDFTEDHIKIWYEGNHYWSTELTKSKKQIGKCIFDHNHDEHTPDCVVHD